ncbi:MAG: ABC transporter substrate-binding protein [Candidatus Eutrophobiaceae bacterium]
MTTLQKTALISTLILLAACDTGRWNSPHPNQDEERQILYRPFPSQPKHLDPAIAYSSDEYAFIAQIYEPPLQYHFLKRPYQLTTLTATAMPKPEYRDAAGAILPPDADRELIHRVHYTIRIREGVRYQPHPAFARDAQGKFLYHNLEDSLLADVYTLADFPQTGSRELQAEDYVYQIKRLVHPERHSPLGALLKRYVLGMKDYAETLKQAHDATPDAWLDLRSYPLAGVRAIDKYTYEIVLERKYPQLLYWLAMPFFAPMPWEATRFYAQEKLAERNITLDWYPVGTGPYMLVENNPNRRMVLERNPNFWGELYPSEGEEGDTTFLRDAKQPMPFIDQAIYSLEKESIPAWNKFLQGYYDYSAINPDSFDHAVQFDARGNAQITDAVRGKDIRLLTSTMVSSMYFGFNMQNETIGGSGESARLLRRAIAIAVDYEEFISIFLNGRGVIAQGPLPPGIFGHRSGEQGYNPFIYRWENDQAVRRNLEEALELMRQAGYPNGRDSATGQGLVLYFDTVSSGSLMRTVSEWYRKQFSKLGINLQIRTTDYNRFQEKMRNGTAQMYSWGWNADYPDPENFFFLLYGPNAIIDGQGKNASNYRNPKFDALFERVANMDNTSKRQELIDRMVALLREDSPWLWGYHPIGYTLYHAWYGNAKPNLMANNTLKYKRINATQRAAKRREWNRAHWEPVTAVLCAALFFVLASLLVWRHRQTLPKEASRDQGT